MADSVLYGEGFAVSFSNREVTAWGGLALFKQMLVIDRRKGATDDRRIGASLRK